MWRQSNMALETYYTFSADTLKAEVGAGKFKNLRHYMFGGMGLHFEATTPQWATTQNTAGTASAGSGGVWHNLSSSTALPSLDNATKHHSAYAQFAAVSVTPSVFPPVGKIGHKSGCRISDYPRYLWSLHLIQTGTQISTPKPPGSGIFCYGGLRPRGRVEAGVRTCALPRRV